MPPPALCALTRSRHSAHRKSGDFRPDRSRSRNASSMPISSPPSRHVVDLIVFNPTFPLQSRIVPHPNEAFLCMKWVVLKVN